MNENDLYRFIGRLSDKAESEARRRQDLWREQPKEYEQRVRARILRKVTEASDVRE